MPSFEIKSFTGLSDYEDRGLPGAFKFATNLNVRRQQDNLTGNQALVDEGLHSSRSPSASVSPSASQSPSHSPSPTQSVSSSLSPSSSASHSPSPSTGISDSPSRSPSASASPSASVSPSHSPSPSPSATSALNTVFEDLVRWFVAATDGYLYGFGSTGVIYRRTPDGVWSRVYKDENGEIKGAIEKPSDSGRTYLQWATNNVLKRKELPGRLDWNDVEIISTELSSADWHTMRQVEGANLIANVSRLAMVGYDDSITMEALNLIPGNIAKTIVERNGRAVIGTYKTSNPTKGINAAIDSEIPLAQVGDDGELFYANFSDSVPVKQFPGGGKCNPGGVCNAVEQVNFFDWEATALNWIDKQSVGNLSLWAVYGAEDGKNGIYSYGRKNKNKPFSMNLDYQIDADELGGIIDVDGTIFVSYRDGSDFGVYRTDETEKADYTYEGLDLRSPVKKPILITNWKYAEVFTDPLIEGTKVQFWYKMDKNGDFIKCDMEGGYSEFAANGEKKGVFNIAASGDIFEPKVVGLHSGNNSPVVHRIKIYFD